MNCLPAFSSFLPTPSFLPLRALTLPDAENRGVVRQSAGLQGGKVPDYSTGHCPKLELKAHSSCSNQLGSDESFMQFSLLFKACWDILNRGERGRVRLKLSLSQFLPLSGSKLEPCNYLKNKPDSHGSLCGLPWWCLMKQRARRKEAVGGVDRWLCVG